MSKLHRLALSGRILRASLCLASLLGCSLEARMGLNQVQAVGSHNSYHVEPEAALLAALSSFDPALAASLEYTALPLGEQLERGVRQLELDVFADPAGGLYASRAGLIAIGRDPDSGLRELEAPGLKVLHIQDIDFRSHCLSFVACLEQLAAWSDEHPRHLPILVMVEPKQDAIPDPLGLGFVTPVPFGVTELESIDTEIRSVFDASRLITPDDVRGSADSLERALLERGWPTLIESRGRFLFAMLANAGMAAAYVADHPTLEERAMFVSSERGRPYAAFFNRDSALIDGSEIRELVRAGYLVRTRADIDTREARSNDTRLRESAFASGAQFVSTDYVAPDPDFGTGYEVGVPGGFVARCNPVTAPSGCASARVAELEER